MEVSRDALKRAMANKSDRELYDVLYVHSSDYTLEALDVAKDEFVRRKMSPESFAQQIGAAAGQQLRTSTVAANANPIRGTGSSSEFGCLVVALVVCGAVYGIWQGGYKWADTEGYLAHRADTVITARSDWLVGESKDCLSPVLDDRSAILMKKEVGYALSSVGCDDGQEHQMSVTFYGREVQAEYKIAHWRCTREQTSFTCYQTGGE
jgi:hypothetical protein